MDKEVAKAKRIANLAKARAAKAAKSGSTVHPCTVDGENKTSPKSESPPAWAQSLLSGFQELRAEVSQNSKRVDEIERASITQMPWGTQRIAPQPKQAIGVRHMRCDGCGDIVLVENWREGDGVRCEDCSRPGVKPIKCQCGKPFFGKRKGEKCKRCRKCVLCGTKEHDYLCAECVVNGAPECQCGRLVNAGAAMCRECLRQDGRLNASGFDHPVLPSDPVMAENATGGGLQPGMPARPAQSVKEVYMGQPV